MAQKGDEIRFTLFERAKVNPSKIPDFVARYEGMLKFYADKRLPYFAYRLKMNSRQKESVTEIIDKILTGAASILEDEVK